MMKGVAWVTIRARHKASTRLDAMTVETLKGGLLPIVPKRMSVER
jgi:hypothetical protein